MPGVSVGAIQLSAIELFGKIRTQFPKIKLGDANSNVTDRPKDARFFEFDFIKRGKNLGTVSLSISEDDGMIVMFSNDITADQPSGVSKQWYNFLRELREFAKQNMMNFAIRDTAKSNLDKRDYQHLAKNNGDGSMTEGEVSEALQMAVLKELPILYLVQDNDWGISASGEEMRAMDAYEFAAGFKGLKRARTDGSDFVESYQDMK